MHNVVHVQAENDDHRAQALHRRLSSTLILHSCGLVETRRHDSKIVAIGILVRSGLGAFEWFRSLPRLIQTRCARRESREDKGSLSNGL